MTNRVRKHVREAMKQKGITSTELGNRVGSSLSSISRLLSSTRTEPEGMPVLWDRVLTELDLELDVMDREKVPF